MHVCVECKHCEREDLRTPFICNAKAISRIHRDRVTGKTSVVYDGERVPCVSLRELTGDFCPNYLARQ